MVSVFFLIRICAATPNPYHTTPSVSRIPCNVLQLSSTKSYSHNTKYKKHKAHYTFTRRYMLMWRLVFILTAEPHLEAFQSLTYFHSVLDELEVTLCDCLIDWSVGNYKQLQRSLSEVSEESPSFFCPRVNFLFN